MLHPPKQLSLMTFSRLGHDEYFTDIANLVAKRSTCRRRVVGCVLVDSQNHIVATGYNGVPAGFKHCLDIPCEGAVAPSGTQLNECWAVHAEMNALLQLQSDDELTAYITTTPCFECAKVISNSKIKRIVAPTWYPAKYVKEILDTAGIKVCIGGENDI